MSDPRGRHTYLAVTCHGTPTQIEGAAPNGDLIYFRFRWGVATLSVNGEAIWTERYGHDMSGVMEPDDAFRLVAALLDLREAHLALRAALPLTPVPPLDEEGRAFMARLTAPSTD